MSENVTYTWAEIPSGTDYQKGQLPHSHVQSSWSLAIPWQATVSVAVW
jgi:hypothetical protein